MSPSGPDPSAMLVFVILIGIGVAYYMLWYFSEHGNPLDFGDMFGPRKRQYDPDFDLWGNRLNNQEKDPVTVKREEQAKEAKLFFRRKTRTSKEATHLIYHILTEKEVNLDHGLELDKPEDFLVHLADNNDLAKWETEAIKIACTYVIREITQLLNFSLDGKNKDFLNIRTERLCNFVVRAVPDGLRYHVKGCAISALYNGSRHIFNRFMRCLFKYANREDVGLADRLMLDEENAVMGFVLLTKIDPLDERVERGMMTLKQRIEKDGWKIDTEALKKIWNNEYNRVKYNNFSEERF